MRYAWVILAAAVFLIGPSIAAAQLTSLRVGTNSPASTEAVLFSIAKDAAILKQNQLDVEVIYIDDPALDAFQVGVDERSPVDRS